METVSIRGLRGAALRDRARKGEVLAITNHRVLVGVLIPAVAGWVEHLIYQNWSRVRQSIAEGEQAMADGTPMVTIQEMIGEPDAAGHGQGPGPGTAPAGRPDVPLAAAIVGGAVAQAPESKEALERFLAAWNPPGLAARQESSSAEPSVVVRTVCTVRIGDLSARLIEEAGANGQALAITHDRELIGILIPVTQGLVQFLIEQNMSRVLDNIGRAEEELEASDKMTTLDQVI